MGPRGCSCCGVASMGWGSWCIRLSSHCSVVCLTTVGRRCPHFHLRGHSLGLLPQRERSIGLPAALTFGHRLRHRLSHPVCQGAPLVVRAHPRPSCRAGHRPSWLPEAAGPLHSLALDRQVALVFAHRSADIAVPDQQCPAFYLLSVLIFYYSRYVFQHDFKRYRLHFCHTYVPNKSFVWPFLRENDDFLKKVCK